MAKKVLQFVLIVCLCVGILGLNPQNIFAQQNVKEVKKAQKDAKKIYKTKLQDFKKDGWQTASTSKTIEMELTAYAEKREQNPTLIEVIGEVNNCKSINVCKQTALNNAQNYYLQLVSGKIKGAFGSVIKSNANMPEEEIDKTIGNLTKQCEADLSGSLIPCFSIVRERNGLKEYKTTFLADPGKIVATMERSLKETKLTIEEIKTITKFVEDELNKEAENQD